MIDAIQYIGQIINVKMDRPLGSKHPKYGFEYPVNYGFVPNTISGDGEELDAYVLGVDKPLDVFKGQCIAVIHRTDDDDDKLVVVPEGFNLSDEYIERQIAFQEKWFKHVVVRSIQTDKKQCLQQRFDENTKVLILGTMPGDVSLGQQQYYAHPRNLFWTMIAEHFNNGKTLTEDERYDFLAKHHIGLCDVLKVCYRKGSLDKDIKTAIYNDFSNIYEMCSNLQRIFLNGKKAYGLFIKQYPELTDICECMPSTSPANTQNKAEKLAQWHRLKDFV